MTADALRAAIAADCPHRLNDYDRHRQAARFPGEPTHAFRVLWWTEHHISADPALAAQIDGLYRQAQDSATREEALGIFAQVNEIRDAVQQQVIKEMGSA
ncbi:hypothetical protein ABTX80_24860 [Streptomyces erythrochromogenes]|uniref:hypothetical protein n=1 Tax=Streptomyces erythrochromogenes TaxID=285574 RepID=UPI00331C9931